MMNPGNQYPHQRMKLAPNTYHSNSSTSSSHVSHHNHNQNSYYKSQMLRIYSTETAQEPLWLVREKRGDSDPDAGSPRSCDNTINTSTESKYDDEELEAAIEAFAWFKGEQRATTEASRLRAELSDALAEVARLNKYADTVTADMARLQMEVQRSEDRHSAASPMSPTPQPTALHSSPVLDESVEELTRLHAHAEAVWLKEKKGLCEELTALREEKELLVSREDALRGQLKKDFSSQMEQLEAQLLEATEASQSANVNTVDELNRLQSNHDIALAELENLKEELKLAQEESAWLRADKDIAEEGAKVKAKITAAADAARQKDQMELREGMARLEEELSEARAQLEALGHSSRSQQPPSRQLQPRQQDASSTQERDEGECSDPSFESMYDLVVRLQAKEKLAEALPICRDALAGMRGSLGDGHATTLVCMNTLATLHYGLGEYAAAEPLALESYHGMRSLLGKQHEQSLTSMVNLAVLWQALKKLDQAETLFREFFDLRDGVLEDVHPDCVRAMNNLSLLLQSQGKVTEAEPYCRRSLECMRETLGELHPDTLQSISNLAMLLYGQGKLEDAEPYCYEALSGMRTTLGNSHMSTLASVSNLAMMLQAQKKLESAEPYCREALAGMRNTLGNTHSITLASVSNLAMLLYNRGQLDESEVLYREAYETMLDSLGADDPSTLAAMSNLAMLLQSQGKLDDAATLFRDCLLQRQRVLGDTHPDTIRSLNSLACLLQSQGKISEAEDIYRETFVMVQQRAEASAAEEVERYKERMSESSQSGRSDDFSGKDSDIDQGESMYVNYDEEGLILKGTLSNSTLNSLDSEEGVEGTMPVANLNYSRRGTPGVYGDVNSATGDSQSVLSSTSSTARLMMMASQSPKQAPVKKPVLPMQLIKCAHDKCRKKFTSLERYISHLQVEHKDSKEVVDKVIGLEMSPLSSDRGKNKPSRQAPVATVMSPSVQKSEEHIYFGCKYDNCPHLFKNMIDRNAHEREAHANGINCNTSISSISSNSTGTATSPPPPRDFAKVVPPAALPCPDKSCKKTFKSAKDRNNHMKDAHGLVMRSGVVTPPPGLALFSPPPPGLSGFCNEEAVFQAAGDRGAAGGRGSGLNMSGDSSRQASHTKPRLAVCPFAGCSKQCKSDAGLLDHIRKAHSTQAHGKQKSHRSPDVTKHGHTSHKGCVNR